MAQAHAVFAVQYIAQATCADYGGPACYVPARQVVALIGAGHVGIKVGCVVGQQAAGWYQTVSLSTGREAGSALDPVVLPECGRSSPRTLRGKPLGRKAPLRTQDGAVIQSATSVFRSGLADAVKWRPATDNAPARGRSERRATETEAAQKRPCVGLPARGAGQAELQAVASKGSGAVRSLTSAATFRRYRDKPGEQCEAGPSTRALSTT